MVNSVHMEIHVHKLGKGKKYRVSLVDGAATVQEEVVMGVKSRDELVWKWCDLYDTVDIVIHEEKAKEFKYSEIPSIPVLEEEDAQEFFEEQQNFVYSRIIQAVHEGIQTDLTEIRLFELNGTGVYMTSKRETWEAGLRQALEYFETSEEYERCGQIMILLNQI
jgi:hypothetical protein